MMRRAFWRMNRALTIAALDPLFRSLALVAAWPRRCSGARAGRRQPDGRFADRVAMVLIRGGNKAGFCTGLVLSPRVLLTAAHCLRPLRTWRLLSRRRRVGGHIPVDAAIAHRSTAPTRSRRAWNRSDSR